MAGSLLTEDAIGPGAFGAPPWGIFGQGGTPMLEADSVFRLGMRGIPHIERPRAEPAVASLDLVPATPAGRIIGVSRTSPMPHDAVRRIGKASGR